MIPSPLLQFYENFFTRTRTRSIVLAFYFEACPTNLRDESTTIFERYQRLEVLAEGLLRQDISRLVSHASSQHVWGSRPKDSLLFGQRAS